MCQNHNGIFFFYMELETIRTFFAFMFLAIFSYGLISATSPSFTSCQSFGEQIFDNDYDQALEKFTECYPNFNPSGITKFVKTNWDKIQ